MAETDIAVIGAGLTGRGLAGLAAALGLKVTLFERGPMGGEAPDPETTQAALRAMANRAACAGGPPGWADVRARLAEADAEAAPDATEARFQGMGVEVVRAAARFAAPDAVAAGGREWRFRRALIATGAVAAVPALEGLETIPYLDEAGLAALDALPSHLLVLGGTAFGLEMAQAFARLGARVTVVEAARIAPGADPDLAHGLARVLRRDGVGLLEGQAALRVQRRPGGLALFLSDGQQVEGSHLLLAPGRQPQLAGLDLAAAGLSAVPVVDRALRVQGNRRVWAAGGAVGREGAADLGILARTMLFRIPGTPAEAAPLRSIRTEPALVEIGAPGDADETLRWPLADTTRAAADGISEGLVKLHVDRRGRLSGAGLLAPGGLEMAGMLSLALRRPVSELAGATLPHPTLSAAIARAALEHRAPALGSATLRWLAGIAKRLP